MALEFRLNLLSSEDAQLIYGMRYHDTFNSFISIIYCSLQ